MSDYHQDQNQFFEEQERRLRDVELKQLRLNPGLEGLVSLRLEGIPALEHLRKKERFERWEAGYRDGKPQAISIMKDAEILNDMEIDF